MQLFVQSHPLISSRWKPESVSQFTTGGKGSLRVPFPSLPQPSPQGNSFLLNSVRRRGNLGRRFIYNQGTLLPTPPHCHHTPQGAPSCFPVCKIETQEGSCHLCVTASCPTASYLDSFNSPRCRSGDRDLSLRAQL